eukprot:scaffold248_cov127-Skeletonema_dohrnii-CCMP3373.AAC.10
MRKARARIKQTKEPKGKLFCPHRTLKHATCISGSSFMAFPSRVECRDVNVLDSINPMHAGARLKV